MTSDDRDRKFLALLQSMKVFGLVGYPLSHSYSQHYFSKKFTKEGRLDHEYRHFALRDLAELPGLIHGEPDLVGFNVTIPHKRAIIPLLDGISSEAQEIGAVNTVRIREGRLWGYNTDWIGFRNTILPLLEGRETGQALILGSGGSAQAVRYVLRQLAIPFVMVARRRMEESILFEDLQAEHVARSTLIIQTTPLGMYPDITTYPPIPYEAVGPGHLLFDLIYNPAETVFLKRGRERGALTKNGLEMLYQQAEAAWEIWNTD